MRELFRQGRTRDEVSEMLNTQIMPEMVRIQKDAKRWFNAVLNDLNAPPFAELKGTFKPRSRSRRRPEERQPPRHTALAGPGQSQGGGRFVLSWGHPRPKEYPLSGIIR